MLVMVAHASPLPEPHFSVSEAASSLPVSRACYVAIVLLCIERLTNRESWQLLAEYCSQSFSPRVSEQRGPSQKALSRVTYWEPTTR